MVVFWITEFTSVENKCVYEFALNRELKKYLKCEQLFRWGSTCLKFVSSFWTTGPTSSSNDQISFFITA